jgi:hypothetical protein
MKAPAELVEPMKSPVSTSEVAVTGESQWQPAFAKMIHPRESIKQFLFPSGVSGRIVRVRPFVGMRTGIILYRKIGCDAEHFFEVHPQDANGYNVIGCEHEILTD